MINSLNIEKEIYISPAIRTFEVEVKQCIATSGTSINEMNEENDIAW